MGDIDIEKGIFMLTRVFYMCLAIILSISSKLTRRFVRYIQCNGVVYVLHID